MAAQNFDYQLKETKAPEGYRIPVDSNGNVHVYEVVTESQPSNGIFNFTIDGVKYNANMTAVEMAEVETD